MTFITWNAPMHAFVTRHKVIVVALLVLCILAYLGLYAVRRLAADRPPPPARSSSAQMIGDPAAGVVTA